MSWHHPANKVGCTSLGKYPSLVDLFGQIHEERTPPVDSLPSLTLFLLEQSNLWVSAGMFMPNKQVCPKNHKKSKMVAGPKRVPKKPKGQQKLKPVVGWGGIFLTHRQRTMISPGSHTLIQKLLHCLAEKKSNKNLLLWPATNRWVWLANPMTISKKEGTSKGCANIFPLY